MNVKLFEVRDRGTLIPMLAVEMTTISAREAPLLRRAGYGEGYRCIMMIDIQGGRAAHYDPYSWGDRTFHVAHLHITEEWDRLVSGDVIDVRHVLGEAEAACGSDLR